MKITKVLSAVALCAGSIAALSSCSKESEQVTAKNEISADAISKIQQLGFTTKDAQKVEGGYLVEGDILLTDEALNSKPDYKLMRIAEGEQYRTNNLVSVGSGRTISIRVSTSLPSAYVTATDELIRRYNAQNLLIRFTRVTSGGNIVLSAAPSGSGYLASAGFPSGGNPYGQVLVNSGAIGTANATTYIATILAHEVGHCIGFRHTDYMNRAYSCGGAYTNEGASTVGAVHIPGTPTTADPNSWMLACIGSGGNRPFNTNDVTALRYIY
ncbi:M57 family metalloprotease [Hymenobacter cellulosivorans]|uniref:Zinc-dependent metalloprotease n=1 Tax=Hymenobacter cellulosivorans TaxID=2932249 RepID=A0ABY4FAN0_9BACT|nr:M57 family metalloprotease [Hymenobacter cellulosivorans]UOQ53157.1 zinc-dependent metalloprotease [Hymenobacter cellulosivorans]